MAERYHINSDEFEQWLAGVVWEDDDGVLAGVSRETLYDLWVEGYSEWQIPGILS